MMAIGMLIPLGILLLLLAGLVTGIVLWATSGSSIASAKNEMSCGKCGYAVRGLSQLNCPECGADLREVGIKRLGSPRRRTIGMVLTIICGLLLLTCCGASGFLFTRVATPVQVSPTTSSQPSPATPATTP